MRVGACFALLTSVVYHLRSFLPHSHFVGHFQGGAADSADDGGAVSAGEWIGDLASASGAVEKRLRLGFVGHRQFRVSSFEFQEKARAKVSEVSDVSKVSEVFTPASEVSI
jgi:hypothetical protein